MEPSLSVSLCSVTDIRTNTQKHVSFSLLYAQIHSRSPEPV